MNSPKNYAIGLLALTTLGGAIMAWQQYGELVERRAAAMNREERQDARQRLSDLERQNRDLQEQLAVRQGTEGLDEMIAETATAQKTERSSRDRSRSDSGRGGPDGKSQQATALRELLAKPEVQAMLSMQQKAAIEARYGALFKNLNLSGEQADKLKSLLAERGTTRRDIEEAARAQGINPRENPEGYRKLFTDAQNEINAGIKTVIGEQGFAQLQNYEQTMPQRSVVDNLQQRLAQTGMPLSPSQSEQLVQILAANAPQRAPAAATISNSGTTSQQTTNRDSGTPGSRPGPGSGGPGFDFGRLGPDIGRLVGGGGGPGGTLAVVVTPAAVAQAQTVLAPPQVAVLQNMQQQQQTQQQLQQLIRDTMAANAPAAKGATASAPTTGATPGTANPTTGQRKRGGE